MNESIMRKLQILILFLLSSIFVQSQNSVDNKSELIINSSFFHNFKIEKYFIHTNKTTYFAGEKVWFKTYVVENGSNLPFIEATNLHLNLYNEDLELVNNELVYVENGKGYGQFQLPKDIKQGFYYAQIDSQWNKNFNNKTALFKIEVLNLSEQDRFNAIAPIQHIKHTTDTEDSNCNIYRNKALEDEQTYALEINIKKSVKDNKELNNNYLFATLHRQGNLKSIIPILIEQNKTNYKIAFQKQDTFDGFNTVSLVTETEEVLSNQSFFWKKTKAIDLEIIEHSKTNDTLTLNLKMLNHYKKANISISVLPQNTQLYSNNANITSAFLIEPYLKANNYQIANLVSEQPINTNKLNYITKIAASETTFPNKDLKISDLKFKMENGVTLNGTINTKTEDLSTYKVMLSSKKNDILELTEINNDRTFSFNNLMLMHPSDYDLVLINEKGEMEKASFFVYNNHINYTPSKILPKTLIYKQSNTTEFSTKIENEYKETKHKKLPILINDVESLDEVLITTTKAKDEMKLKKELIRKKGILGLAYSKIYEPQESSYSHVSVFDYIQTIPGATVQYGPGGTFQLFTYRNGQKTSISVRVDGAFFTDLTLLNQYQIKDFKYVIFNRKGVGYGIPIIDLITDREYDSKKPIANSNIQNLKTAFGFNKPQTNYEKPELQYTDKEAVGNYSTVDWIPNFEITPESNNILKINRLDYNNIKLIINGISEDGTTIYKEHLLSLSND